MVGKTHSKGTMKFQIVLEAQPEGGWTAQCVEVPGAISEGETLDEAVENAMDAIREILAVRREAARRAASHGSRVQTVEVNA